MAEWYEYIKIRGLPPTASTQVFQGIGGSGTYVSDDTGTGTDETEDIGLGDVVTVLQEIADIMKQDVLGDGEDGFPQALWAAQSTAIDKESKYLQQLNALYKKKHRILSEEQSAVLDFFTQIASNKIGMAAAGMTAVSGVGAGAAPAVGLVVNFVSEVGLGMVFDKLSSLLTEGNKLLEAMISENDGIVGMGGGEGATPNFRAYQARADIQKRHVEQMQLIMEQVSGSERELRENLSISGLTQLSQDFRDVFMSDVLDQETGLPILDDNGNPVKAGYLDDRLQELIESENIVQCPHTGHYLYTKSLRRAGQ